MTETLNLRGSTLIEGICLPLWTSYNGNDPIKLTIVQLYAQRCISVLPWLRPLSAGDGPLFRACATYFSLSTLSQCTFILHRRNSLSINFYYFAYFSTRSIVFSLPIKQIAFGSSGPCVSPVVTTRIGINKFLPL